MAYRSAGIRKLLDRWPGKKTLGIYRFLPLFFALGAALEFSMINWHVGEVNFCKLWSVLVDVGSALNVPHFCTDRTFKKRKAEEIAEAKERQKYMPIPPAVAAVLKSREASSSSS